MEMKPQQIRKLLRTAKANKLFHERLIKTPGRDDYEWQMCLVIEEQILIDHYTELLNPKPTQVWQIEKVDRYWYWSGRNARDYVEVTFWFNHQTTDRKETRRTESIYSGEEYKLPDWAKAITENRSVLNN